LKKQTAILFFSRSAKLEAQHKKWIKNADKNYGLAQLLVNSSYSYLKTLDQPVYFFDEALQSGNSFGEKLSNAFETLYNKGYDSVISVGNDFCEWQSLNWTEVLANLKNQKAVIGPNQRGGAYLIGIPKAQFRRNSFKDLSWQSGELYEELRHALTIHKTPTELGRKRDINSSFDVLLLLKSLRKSGKLTAFHRILAQILLAYKDLNNSFQLHYRSKQVIRFGSLRAPPIG